MIKCDLQESEDQTIVRYLGGLDPRYSNVVELQQYTSFDQVCILAHKIEQQRKTRTYIGELPKPPPQNRPFNKGSSYLLPKNRALPPFTPQKTQAPPKSLALQKHPNPNPMSTRRCFKRQGLGHIASECPNRKVITLAK